jgi:hypothetical protein
MDGEMNHRQGATRRARRPAFQAELLEARQLLSVDFSKGIYTVSDKAGAASITLSHNNNGVPPTTAEQVDFSLGGGTAVPGVDYTPTHRTISFAAGETSKTVKIPVLPAAVSAGNRVVQINLAPAAGSAPTSAAFLVIQHSPDTTPPTVASTKMLTKGPYVTGFVLTFSKDMARGQATDVNNYEIDDPRSIRPIKGAEWSYAKREVPLKSATYDPATHSVTLNVSGHVKKFPFFTVLDRPFSDAMKLVSQAIIKKSQPNPTQMLSQSSPLTDTTGNLMDSMGTGTADGHLYTMVSQGKAGSKFANSLKQMFNSIPSGPKA